MTLSVSDALATRVSVRDFLSTPVPLETLKRVLLAAARAPSGGNVQPWHIDVVTGAKLAELKEIMRKRLADPTPPTPEYAVYPKELASPYRDYRFKCGEDMYEQLGVSREDKTGRRKWFMRNYECFGAPAALFCTIGRGMGPPQWSDLGMFLQSVMLMLREEGLDSCAQESWSVYAQEVRSHLGTSPDRMLFCGMSVGYRNPEHPVNALVTDRAGLESIATFHGD